MMLPNANKTRLIKGDVGAINEAIDMHLQRRRLDATKVSEHYESLWIEIRRLVGAGGKRLRPRLMILAYNVFGGRDVEGVLPAAVSMELLHQGMLIHDDIIDRDYLRYGVDNIAAAYDGIYSEMVVSDSDRMHYAHGAAILAGDLMISESYQLLAESRVSAEKILAAQRLLNQSIFDVVGGELLDTESSFRGDSFVSAVTVASYKTASYTFMLPMLVGAELAGASVAEQAYVRDFALNLGIAFQLRDDIIGVFGSEKDTGKSNSGDIREGKRTYMVEQFYLLANEVQKSEFARYFGNGSITDDEVEVVRQLLKSSGSLTRTERAIDEYSKTAQSAWTKVSSQPGFDNQVKDLIKVATTRRA